MDQEFTDRQATIDLRALSRNLALVRDQVGPAKILAVVKADAYGHGLIPTARRLVAEGAAALGVGRIEEVEELRRAGLGVPVVILTGVLDWEAAKSVRLRSIPMVYDLATAEALAGAARTMGRSAEVLLKVDTGMGRLGFSPEEMSQVLDRLETVRGLTIRGVASHLSAADEEDKSFSHRQIETYNRMVSLVRERGYEPDLNTLANSAGVLDLKAAHNDLVRPGIVLYGAKPGPGIASPVEPEPVMTVRTRLIQVKTVPAGSPISYGRTFITRRRTRLGAAAMGYGHGLPRALSRSGGPDLPADDRPVPQMLVRGRRAPIIGRVCMNLTLLDLTDIPEAGVGDEVVIIGRQDEELIRADELAAAAGTIAYEPLCTLGGMNPRVYQDLP